MPWQQQGAGYTTKRGGHIRNPSQYEALRRKGMTKQRAAAITNAVTKRRDDRQLAATTGGAALGAAAGQGAYQATGYGAKHYVDARTRKGGKGVSSAQVNRQDKALRPLKRQHGMHLPQGSPGRSNKAYHRAYPVHLPHGRTIRILGHTHEGKLGMGVGAATTALAAAGGGALGFHLTDRDVKKYVTDAQIRRRKKTAANLGLASAGFGLAALGSRGAEGVLRAKKLPHLANKLSSHTSNALIVGSGVGAVGALNAAAINRAESKRRRATVPVPKKPKEEDLIKASLLGPSMGPVAHVYNYPRKKIKEKTTPTLRRTTKSILGSVSRGQDPNMMLYFPQAVPGGKRLQQLDSVVNKAGALTGLKQGYRLASLPAGAARTSARGGSATQIAGRKAGAMAHDFRAGYSRHVHEAKAVDAGKTTTHANAVYPVLHTAGKWSRRVTPVVVVGTGYGAGKKIGRRRERKQMNVAKSEGRLVPLSKAYAYDYDSDRKTRNGIYVGSSYAGAGLGGLVAAHQGHKALGHIKVNRGRPASTGVKGKLTSVRVAKPGLVHGGRAAGAAAAGTVLAIAGHKANKKSRSGGSWY